jgi:HD superfamily phosphodiesterase
MLDFSKYKKKFTEYANSFLNKDKKHDEDFILKIIHSNNVKKNAEFIAISNNFSYEDFFIAQICGQFHDVGRFLQYHEYQTFKDTKTIKHGELGVKIIKENRFFEDLDISLQEIIYTAIYNHGLYSIEKYQTDKQLFFSKLTRDADKIDIFRLVSEYYNKTENRNIALEYNLEDIPEISKNVFNSFKDKELIEKSELKTLNDFKLMQLSWIYDINFECSRKLIIEKEYLQSILLSISDIYIKNIIKQMITNLTI